jgi:hypothetical protein
VRAVKIEQSPLFEEYNKRGITAFARRLDGKKQAAGM